MNTAACLVSEVDVLPLESAVGSHAAKPEGDSPPLPKLSLKVPSDRDLQIYEEVVFAGRSQRGAAKEFGVSQPRVNQILKEIAVWMADNTPNFCAGLTPEQKLRLVHYNVVQQLEYQRCSLMQAWEDSRHGTETVSRTSTVNGVTRTSAHNRPSRANARYLDAAARVSLSIAKLAGWTPAVAVTDAPQDSPWWKMEEETADRGQEPGRSRQESVGGPREVEEPKKDLSLWDERADHPNLTRAEMNAITAEQQAVCATLQAKVMDLKSKIRQHENTLSPDTGPQLAEGEKVSKNASKQDQKRDQRREFLRGEPPRTTIGEYIGSVHQPDM